jgi:tetratricopeptide (TPR) repeat protein
MDIIGKKRSNAMKKITLLVLLVSLGAGTLQAQKKTFVRDYTYPASEVDSKVLARTNATTQMRTILLRELGEFLHAERVLKQTDTSQSYTEKIEAITAGIVEMKTLDERWDGATYYIKAEMAVDPEDLEHRISEVLADKQKTQELEEARKRVLAAEGEIERLKKELAAAKNEPQRLALKTRYQQTANALTVEEYFTRGRNAQANDFHELAIEYYQKAIDLDPYYKDAYREMNKACYSHDVLEKSSLSSSKKYPEVIQYYQQVIAIHPNNAMTYFYMGCLCIDLKNYNEAVRSYKKVLAIDPDYAGAYNFMGNAYALLKNYDEAIRCWQKEKDFDAKAYEDKGWFYKINDDYNGAIWCFQRAIAIDPSYARAYYGMGCVYHNLKNKHEAIRYFGKATEIDPNYAEAYYGLGFVEPSSPRAIWWHQKALTIDMGQAYSDKGKVYSDMGYSDMGKGYSDMGKSYSDMGKGYYVMGKGYYDTGKRKKAIKHMQQAARLGNSDVREWLREKKKKW